MGLDEGAANQLRARPADEVWLVELDCAESFDELAEVAGLEPLGRGWREIDGDQATALLTSLLHRDLTFGNEVMPAHTAAWLAGQFLRSCGRYGSRFATNTDGVPNEGWRSWTPAAEHSYDAGVAILGTQGAALYWVAEDV